MSNVLVIMGSPRKNGTTSNLYNYFVEQLNDKGIPFNAFNLSTIKPGLPCFDCGHCSLKGMCCLKDTSTPILGEFNRCDTVVWFMPIYFFQMPGVDKNLLDRMHSIHNWENKSFHLIITSGSSGRKGGADILVEVFSRVGEIMHCTIGSQYNKVTNDLILTPSPKDRAYLDSLAETITKKVSCQ